MALDRLSSGTRDGRRSDEFRVAWTRNGSQGQGQFRRCLSFETLAFQFDVRSKRNRSKRHQTIISKPSTLSDNEVRTTRPRTRANLYKAGWSRSLDEVQSPRERKSRLAFGADATMQNETKARGARSRRRDDATARRDARNTLETERGGGRGPRRSIMRSVRAMRAMNAMNTVRTIGYRKVIASARSSRFPSPLFSCPPCTARASPRPASETART